MTLIDNTGVFLFLQWICKLWANKPIRITDLQHNIRSVSVLTSATKIWLIFFLQLNRPVPSYLVPLFQNESSCKTFHTKNSLICMKTNLQSKSIFTWMVSKEDSFWQRQEATRKWPVTLSTRKTQGQLHFKGRWYEMTIVLKVWRSCQ